MDNEAYKLKVLELMQRQVELLEQLVNKKKVSKPKPQNTMTLLEQLEPHKGKYAPSMIEEFTDYWSECERWKREKTWDIEKRLVRWERQQKKWQYEKEAKQSIKTVEEKPTYRESYSGLRPISEILAEKLNQ